MMVDVMIDPHQRWARGALFQKLRHARTIFWKMSRSSFSMPLPSISVELNTSRTASQLSSSHGISCVPVGSARR